MKKKLSLLLALLLIAVTGAWADTVVLSTPSESVATLSDANGIVTIADGSGNTGIQQGSGSYKMTYGETAYVPMKLSGSRNFTLSYKEGVTISKVTLLAMSNGDAEGTVGAGDGDATSLGTFPVRNADGNCLTVEITGKTGLRGSRQFLALIVVEYSTTAPSLKATPDALTFALNPNLTTKTQTFTLTGQNLTNGEYALEVPNLAGLTVAPASFTVADGKVNQEISVTYASTEDVAKATTDITAKVGDMTASVAVTYQSRATAYTQSTISEAATWDWSKLSETVELTDASNPTKTDEFLLADLDDRINFTEAFGDAKAIVMKDMQFPSRAGYAQGNIIKFKTSVAGTIAVDFSNTGGGDRPDRYLNVNGVNTEFKSNSTTTVNATGIAVPAGEVILKGNMVKADAEGGFEPNMLRWYKITFTPKAEGGEEPASNWKDIKADLTQLQDLATESNVYIKVAEDGSISKTENAEEANATLKGKWHGTAYGWSNFTASVPVEGCVKITYATHDYGNDIVVTNEAGAEVAKFNTKGAKWSSDHNNVVSTYYRINKPTTLHFSKANYNPYFAVEAIAEADLPAEVPNYTVTFAAGEGTGVAPATLEVEAGSKITAPKNYYLYKEGYTLTGWSDGTQTYAVGAEITPETDMTLTAVFTENEVSLADRTAAVIISYDLGGYNDNPKYKFEGNTGIIVTQATVAGKSIDVKVDVDATGGKFAHNGSGWHQVNTGTKVTVPSAKDATITVKTYNNANALKFGETAAEADQDPATFKATAEDATLVIEQTANGYWNALTITLPALENGGGEEPHDPVILTWDYSEKDIPTESPADGLYFASYVNDAAGTNNGMHGVKLNSSGWAYFEKPAVAGKLTLTFGNRKSADAYEVNVSKGTLNADGKTATKGDLIGTVAVTESPGTGSIELPADVTGVYIDRKTGAEGVLQKIVFKETVARTFVDFEIPYATLTADGYTGAGLPTGVSFSGSFHDKQHGYQNATMVVPVDGTVKFTISGCQYGGSFPVKNATGETLATLDQKSAGCYDAGGTVTYFYIGNATTLTFGPIQYLSYFKAEATDVQEVTITYKDQNGNVLGKKTVFEGETLGEVPYTEADLTIPEGEKFRGWVYTSGVKVKATDVVTGNVSVNASVTPIETAPETGSMQTYDLTKATFYPEDHENFNVEGGSYYNNHGFTFNAEGSFQVAVSSKAQIVLSLCQYGNGTTITVKDPSGNVIREDVPAKADTDGGTTAINYEGEAGMLTFTFAAQSYLHSVKVYNVSEFIEKDETSGYYIVPAGDAAGLVLALNQAASNPNSKIFLPNGTYDFGEAVLTGISGTNVSIIGQDADKTIIVNAPPVSMEGLEKADLFLNTSTGLYLQDVTLKNDLDYYTAGTGRAAVLHDKGTKTICKNVKMLSYQDTYYSHKVGGVYYFEGGEVHGTVDYMCGNGRVYFNEVKIVNEKRSSATMSANSELYVYNNCVVENNADAYNFGRAWSDHPVCIWLNTTLNDPDKLVNTRWNLTGINCDYSIAGEYGTKNASGTDITPESNTVTFTKENTTLNTILTADQAATYTMEYTLGEWAATAQAETKQVEAPSDAKLENGTITWTAAAGATAYAIFKDGELLGIVDAETTSFVVEDNEAATRRAEGAAPVYTIRVANGRGGFGEARTVTDATAIEKVKADENDKGNLPTYNLNGQRVDSSYKGVVIKNGKKVIVK